MKKLSLCIFYLLTFVTADVFAKGFVIENKISHVAFQSGGFFMYADNWGNPNSCSQSKAIVLLNNDPNYDKAYALLLAAYMSGKTVRGYSDACSTFDGQTYNTIRGFKYLTIKG